MMLKTESDLNELSDKWSIDTTENETNKVVDVPRNSNPEITETQNIMNSPIKRQPKKKSSTILSMLERKASIKEEEEDQK